MTRQGGTARARFMDAGWPTPVRLSPTPSSASIAIVVVVAVMSIAPTGINDAAGEQSTSQNQGDHCYDFGAHDFLPSMAMLVAIRGRRWIPALFPATMFFPAPMLCPALMLALTRLPTMLPASRATPIPVGLNGM